LIYSGYLCSAF